jgi:hypothetical protein
MKRMTTMRAVATTLAALLLAGCASVVTKVGPGEAVVGERLAVPIEAAWNQFPGTSPGPAAQWTTDGLLIDLLSFYVGIKDGAPIAAQVGPNQRPLTFRASMQPHEIAALFESLATRDGSVFTLERLEPVDFLGQRGWRAQYTVLRKFDDVRLSGSAWGVVRDGQLYAITFSAPALGFYPRLLPRVEKIAASARLR